MSRELLLLRHGKAEDTHDLGDFHRELKDKGKRHAQRIGAWLASQQLLPDVVVSSSAERALNTAHKCCKSMGIPADRVEARKALYLASPQVLLTQLQDLRDDPARVMLVGHNPGLEQLLASLCGSDGSKRQQPRSLPTGTLARLRIKGPWSDLAAGQAQLLSLQRGKELPKTFPYPGSQGIEQRDRPAYYYTQSSVVPYRLYQGQLQVLMVRSSSNRHWVVPKGIVDPGLSAQESALKEALEEAGVEGQVVGQPLGNYVYPKWGAHCQVQVFALQVTRELSEQEWEERHRGRLWIGAGMASTILKHAELKPMIETLAARHPNT